MPSKQQVLYVTTPKGCMNLAASVNVILYDRLAKQQRAK
ncbi:RNA methyltransferase [Aeromonas hydrophila]